MSIFDTDINFGDIKSQFPYMFDTDLDDEPDNVVKIYHPIVDFIIPKSDLHMLQPKISYITKKDMGCNLREAEK
jgi:hypothetical protein